MADPFLAEVRMLGCDFAPHGWGFCDGGVLPIAQNLALFSLLSTLYGGDGVNNFALPNLAGQAPIGAGSGPGLPPCNLGETVTYVGAATAQAPIPALGFVPTLAINFCIALIGVYPQRG